MNSAGESQHNPFPVLRIRVALRVDDENNRVPVQTDLLFLQFQQQTGGYGAGFSRKDRGFGFRKEFHSVFSHIIRAGKGAIGQAAQ